ncbi:hypothetical protein ZWY2020_005858 [Hordeum vulgare]|nr:hypothetical protein ZWY2020_005858 [Hordeum vulgare]
MPKRTVGGRADAMAYEASKPRAKLDMEKPIPAGEGSSGQQGGLDVVDDVEALPPEQVAPPPEQVTPVPRHLPPLPQPVVDEDDDGEEVSHLTPIFGNILGFLFSPLSIFGHG